MARPNVYFLARGHRAPRWADTRPGGYRTQHPTRIEIRNRSAEPGASHPVPAEHHRRRPGGNPGRNLRRTEPCASSRKETDTIDDSTKERSVHTSGTDLFSNPETTERSPAPETRTDYRPVFLTATNHARSADTEPREAGTAH